jgi:6-phosphofructokinase
MTVKNALYCQSGGVTAVINATACGVIETARKHPDKIGKVFAARNGIIGALREELIDTSLESDADIASMKHTPGGAFGSCRFKLKDVEKQKIEYERLIEVFKAHNIGTLFYNGGGDSSDTAFKVSKIAEQMGFPVNCIGVPKTIDNDLPITDTCPGFGTTAKYIAVSMMEASLDVESMSESSTKVFIMEVMGRHAGWIAAAGGLAGKTHDEPPQIILFPEVPFDQKAFLERVKYSVESYGYCSIVVSEGVRSPDGKFLADAGPSILATLILLASQHPDKLTDLSIALFIAWFVSAIILFSATALQNVLGKRGLIAIERLMGMVLIAVSVQMFLDGIKSFLRTAL